MRAPNHHVRAVISDLGGHRRKRSASVRSTLRAKKGVSCTMNTKDFSLTGASTQTVFARAPWQLVASHRSVPSLRRCLQLTKFRRSFHRVRFRLRPCGSRTSGRLFRHPKRLSHPARWRKQIQHWQEARKRSQVSSCAGISFAFALRAFARASSHNNQSP